MLKCRILSYSPIKASKILNACSILHNTCVKNDVQPIGNLHYEDEHLDLEIFEPLGNEIVEGNVLNEDLATG